jgi:hypothetical protein
LLASVGQQLHSIKEQMEEFRDKPASGLIEDNKRKVEYRAMQAAYTKVFEVYQSSVKKFQLRQGEGVDLVRKSLITLKNKSK